MNKVVERTFLRRKKGKNLSLGAYQDIEVTSLCDTGRLYRLTLSWPTPTIDIERPYFPMKVVISGSNMEMINHLQDFFAAFAEEDAKEGVRGPDEIVSILQKLGFINLKKVK